MENTLSKNINMAFQEQDEDLNNFYKEYEMEIHQQKSNKKENINGQFNQLKKLIHQEKEENNIMNNIQISNGIE